MSGAPELEQLLQDEADCTLAAFDRDSAWSLGVRIRDLLREQDSPAAVEVVHCGVVAFYSALTGATVDQRDWIRRKREVVSRFGHSSLWVKLSAQPGFHERYRLPATEYAAVGGGVPIHVAGVGHVGTATISGMASDVDEHRLITACIREIQAADEGSRSK